MEIKIQRQFDKLAEDYLDSRDELINIFATDENLIIETEKERFIIPREALHGVLNTPTGLTESDS